MNRRNKRWVKLILKNYDEIFEKCCEAYRNAIEAGRYACFGGYQAVSINSDGRVFLSSYYTNGTYEVYDEDVIILLFMVDNWSRQGWNEEIRYLRETLIDDDEYTKIREEEEENDGAIDWDFWDEQLDIDDYVCEGEISGSISDVLERLED